MHRMTKIPHFEVIRASRRSISIQISKTKWLVVRAPFSVPTEIIHAFVEKKSNWITKHLQAHSEQKERKNNILYYLGKPHSFEYNLLQKEAVTCSEWIFTFNGKVKDADGEESVLIRWYRKQAKLHLTERALWYAEKYNLRYTQVSITSAVTRWGSCSAKNNLNFPWRLMMAPPDVIDYVVVHELAHTVHKNHSSRFWGLVELIIPDWRTYRTHLKAEWWKYTLPLFLKE